MLNVVYGNDESLLADALTEFLFSSSAPFAQRLVVVPHFLMKDFLYSHFEKRLGIAAGVQVLPLNQAVLEIMGTSVKKVPSFIEMTLAIEEQLHELCKDPSFPFHSYLKNNQRIASFSDALSSCFAAYGLYGLEFLEEFLKGSGLQQLLWGRLFSEDSGWTYPIEYLKLEPKGTKFEKIAFFGFSYLAPIYLDFFSKMDVVHYLLSPCSFFWEDLVSDKERVFRKRFLQKRGKNESAIEELDQFLQEGHPLLKNWGGLNRKMLKHLDAFLLNEDEVYVELSSATLLDGIRNSLLNMQAPSLIADASIQLHSAPSILREVEALKSTIDTLMQQHQFLPSDIVVASPDMAAYAPYIATLFSDLPYRIEGVPLKQVSLAVQGFFLLLELPRKEYTISSLHSLFQNESFLEKGGFSEEEVSKLFKWFETAKIRRDLIGHLHSWEAGIDRLLYGFARIPKEGEIFDLWPTACVAKSDMELFNRFLLFFSSLKKDMAELKTSKSVQDWFGFFVRIAEEYFVISWDKEVFFKELRQEGLTGALRDFESMERILKFLANKPVGALPAKTAHFIHFVPLSSGAIKTAKVICCLGMNEGVFPRLDLPRSLFEMPKSAMPLQVEEDRSLFLELFLKAKEYLIWSYLKIHPEDGKEQGPCILIEEFIHYLRQMQIDLRRLDHPSLSFDSSYFFPQAPIKKWSQVDFLAALALNQEKKTPPAFFSDLPESARQRPIEIRKLNKLARHPLQFYFHETLKIFLKNEEDKEAEEFLLSPLYKSLLCKEALKLQNSVLMDKSRAQGKLPRGLFHEVASQEMQEELQTLQGCFTQFGLTSEQITSIDLGLTKLGEIVTGKLENVTPAGLLVHGESNSKNLLKIWPSYLIYRLLDPTHRFLLFTNSAVQVEIPVEDLKKALISYLEYYDLARQKPSPLMPQWFKALIGGKEPPINETKDPYLNYLIRRDAIPNSWERIPLELERCLDAL